MTEKKSTKKNQEEMPKVNKTITEEQMKQLASQLVIVDGFIFKKSMMIEQLPLFLIAIDPTPKQAKFMSELKLEIVDERGQKFFPRETKIEVTKEDGSKKKTTARKKTTRRKTPNKKSN